MPSLPLIFTVTSEDMCSGRDLRPLGRGKSLFPEWLEVRGSRSLTPRPISLVSALSAQLKYNSLGFRILTCHGEDLKDGISEGIGVSYPVFPLTTMLYGQRMRRPYFRKDGKIKAIV